MSVLSPEIIEVPQDENDIPLPIIPSEDFPEDIHSLKLSKHHEYFLQGSKKFGGLGPVAVRGSRVLRVEKEVHNTGVKAFHRFYDQSPVPYSDQERFDTSILNAAGYMPKRGIDLWSGEPIEREIEDGEFTILTTVSEADSMRFKNLIYYTEDLRPFYQKFLQMRNLRSIPPDLAEAFMHNHKKRHSSELGHEIVGGLAEIATQSVLKKYERAYTHGQLNPNVPRDPAELLVHVLGNTEQREKLFTPIRNKLASISLQSRVRVVPLQA